MTARKAAQEIHVQNAMGDAPTVATVVVQNKIDYTPKVSVIIPVYNVEKYLKQCLDSVLGQTLHEIEVICVDDGSTDSSMEILKDYVKQDNRVTILSQKNLHAGVARNAGLAVARGEYLSFLDSDDWFDTDMLNQMYAKAQKDKSDIVVCEYNAIDVQKNRLMYKYKIGNKYVRKSPFSPKKIADSLYSFTNPAAWTKIFRTNFFSDKNLRFENLTSCNDITCTWVALTLADKISIINKPFINYRVNTNTNISANRGKNVNCFFTAIKRIESILSKHGVFDTYRRAFYSKLQGNLSYEMSHVSADKKSETIQNAKQILGQEMFDCLFSPKVSVIVPVYNTEKYLNQCLDSILKQTMSTLEVICVDDGSTDNSWAILQEYAIKDPRVKIFKQKNQGVSAARNFGISKATAEYIHMIDSDDFVDEKLYAETLPVIRKRGLDILAFGIWNYSNGVQTRSSTKELFHRFKKKKIKPRHLIRYFLLSSCNKIYKTDFIRQNKLTFPVGIRISEDSAFGNLGALCKPRFGLVNGYYIFYRRDNLNSVMHHNNFALTELIKSYDYIIGHMLYKKAPKHLKWAIDIRILASIQYQIDNCDGGLDAMDNGRAILKQWLETMLDKWGKKISEERAFKRLEMLLKPVVPLVVAADDNYAQPTAVSLYSILKNTKAFVDIFVLSNGISEYNIGKIKRSLEHFTNFRIKFIDMTEFDLKRFPKIERFNQSVFCRYFIPEICQEYDKVIYSDVDVLFCGDICDYYNIDLNGYGIAAVSEEMGLPHTNKHYSHERRKELFGIPMNHKYFANGNIIIDCEYWRKNNITQKLIDLTIKWADKLVCPDLDVMNILFAENYKRLDWKYCCCVHRKAHIGKCEEMRQGFKNPFIIHYSGHLKPWATRKCLFARQYIKILKKTRFKRQAPKNAIMRYLYSIRNSIKSRSRKLLTDKIYAQQQELEKLKTKNEELINILDALVAEINKLSLQSKNKFADMAECFYALPRAIQQNNANSMYEIYLKQWYREKTGQELDITNPKTYNEKIQWLKLFDSTPIKTRLADKYLVRDWVADKIGEQYLIPLLGVYDCFEDIDFDKLPNQFVIKCNHGSGYNIIVTDKSKMDFVAIKAKLDKWMTENFAFKGCELHYRDIPPKIIIEEYIDPQVSGYEIQLWVFEGQIKFVSFETVKTAKEHKRGLFYTDKTKCEFKISPNHYADMDTVPADDIFERALAVGEKLILDVPYVRIDLIEYNGNIKFREMTFTSGSGLSAIVPEDYSDKLGEMIQLPKQKYNVDTKEFHE